MTLLVPEVPALLTFIIFPFFIIGSVAKFRTWWYERATKATQTVPSKKTVRIVRGVPPAWSFGLIWFVVNGCYAAAGYVYWRNTYNHDTYDWFWGLYIGTAFMMKIWANMFYGIGGSWGAFLGAVSIVLSFLGAAALTVIAFVTKSTWPGILFIPLDLWLIYAAYINFQFVWHRDIIYGRNLVEFLFYKREFKLEEQRQLELKLNQQQQPLVEGKEQ